MKPIYIFFSQFGIEPELLVPIPVLIPVRMSRNRNPTIWPQFGTAKPLHQFIPIPSWYSYGSVLIPN